MNSTLWFNSMHDYRIIRTLDGFPKYPENIIAEFVTGMRGILPEGISFSVIYLHPGAHGCNDPMRQRAELIWEYPASKHGQTFFT